MRRRICNKLVKLILTIEKMMVFLQKGCDHPGLGRIHLDSDSDGSHVWCGVCRKEM